jgi:hypothetical protein
MIWHRRAAKEAEKEMNALAQKSLRSLRLCSEKLYFNKHSKQ